MGKQVIISTTQEYHEWALLNKVKHIKFRDQGVSNHIYIGFLGKTVFNIPFNLSNYLTEYLDYKKELSYNLVIDLDVYFENMEFNQGLHINNIDFTGNLTIKGCTATEFGFYNCNFNSIHIILGIIQKVFEIANCKSNCIEISKMKTTPDTYLRIIDSSFKKLSIVQFILQGWGEINNVNSNLSLKNLILNSNLIINDDSKLTITNWETACILKNEELKQNNIVKSLEYQAKEKELLEKEKWKSEPYKYEWFSLWLGRVFHNHGQNWFLAFQCTIYLIILSWSLFYTSWSTFISLNWWTYQFTSGQYLSGLIKYLVPTNYSQLYNYLSDIGESPIKRIFSILPFMFGKIVLPYGIYEIIKSFRKYK